MSALTVLHQLELVIKVFIACLAVVVLRALYPMLYKSMSRFKIPFAIPADVMETGVGLVLLESVLISEVAITTLTVHHRRRKK